MMPAEKLALTERSYAAFNDGLDIELLIPLYHADCEWRMGSMGAAFGMEAFRGHDELREFVSGLHEGFEAWTNEIDEARVAGPVGSRSASCSSDLPEMVPS